MRILPVIVFLMMTLGIRLEPAPAPELTYDVYAQSHITAEQYDVMLEGSALAGCGDAFRQIETEYGVNGLFAIAVCNLESSLGQYPANTNNFFGFMGANGWMSFSTKRDGITYFGELLSGYPYYGKTIDQIASIYCPGSTVWASTVRCLMQYNFDKI